MKENEIIKNVLNIIDYRISKVDGLATIYGNQSIPEIIEITIQETIKEFDKYMRIAFPRATKSFWIDFEELKKAIYKEVKNEN